MTIHLAATAPASTLPFSGYLDPSATAGESLLPTPATADPSGDLGDVYKFVCETQDGETASDQNAVTVQSTDRKNELAQEKKDLDAEQKAQEGGHGLFGSIEKLVGDVAKDVVHLNAKDLTTDLKSDIGDDMWNNPHFWSDLASVAKNVGEVAAIVGGAALTVGTGGAAGVVVAVAVALSVSAMADQQLHVLHALGVSDKAAGLIDGGAMVASALMTGGVTIAQAAGTTLATTAATQLTSRLTVSATVVDGASAGATGVATLRQGQFDASAADAAADETEDQHDIDHSDRLTAWFLAALQQGKQDLDKAKATVQGCIETRNSATVAMSSFSKA